MPRRWLVDEIDDWLENGPEHVFLLTGDSGTGKSVLSDWITSEAPTDDPVLARLRSTWDATFFCSQRYLGSSTDPRAFIRQVSNQLSANVAGFAQALLAQQKPLVQGTANIGQVSAGATVSGATVNTLIVEGTSVEEMYQQALETPLVGVLEQTGERVTILVDGVDEGLDEPSPRIGELASSLVRAHPTVRLLVTSKDDRAAAEPFEELTAVGCRHLDLSSRERRQQVEEDIQGFVRARDGGPELRQRGVRRLGNVTRGNFLHAKGLLEAVEAEGEAAIDSQRPVPGLAASYEQQLLRLLQRNFGEGWRDEWEGSVADLFAVLAVARSPLELDAVADLLDEDPPSTRMAIDRFGQLVDPQGELIGFHPTFAAFLLSPLLPDGDPNRFHVDGPQAHLRMAKWCLSRATETPLPATAAARYALLHAPTHVAALGGELPPDQQRALVEETFRAMIDTGFRLWLREEISDPVLLGRPYRQLAELLASGGHGEMLEQLVTALATAEEPALRAVALEALLLYAKAKGPDSLPFICRLALSPDPTPRLVALKAICRLDREEQVKALEEVITKGGSEVRIAASYALYANWNTEPAALTSEVLLELADLVALYRPRSLQPLLEFLSSVTITNYINNCGDIEVAELTSTLWRRIFHERLHLNRLNRPFLERSVVVPIAARHFAERVLGGATGFDSGDDSLLPLPAERRQQVRTAIEGLDPDVRFDRIEADVAQLGGSEVLIFRILAAQVVAIRAVTDFESLEGPLRRLFEAGSTRLRTTLVLALTTQLRGCPPAWRSALEWMTGELVGGEAASLRPVRDPLLAALDLLFVPLGLAYCRAGERMSMHERLIASPETDPEVRKSCIAGTAIVGLYSPNLALAALEPAADADGEFLSAHALEALGVIRSLHQAAVDRWIGEWGDSTMHESVLATGGFDTARLHIEAIGLYTNGVHQAIHYPFMRNTVLREVFTLMCDSKSVREWSKSYTQTVLRALRTADYTLINWTKL